MDKQALVFTQVEALYKNSSRMMGAWMWNNHVQWVANKARELAIKYAADVDKVYCAALLHDLGDCVLNRSDAEFNARSERKAVEILQNADFSPDDIEDVMSNIIGPHSCRPGNLPSTQEGKVLATADAMFHLQTSFFLMLCYMNRPEHTETYEDWQEWFVEKIERDFNHKIFFEEEKDEVKDDYEALIKVFTNRTLSSV
jgi:predicted hydrolase (HD superfamily)